MVILKRGDKHNTPCRNETLIGRLRLTGRNKSYLREQQMDWEWAIIPVIKERGDASEDIQSQGYHAGLLSFFGPRLQLYFFSYLTSLSPPQSADKGWQKEVKPSSMSSA